MKNLFAFLVISLAGQQVTATWNLFGTPFKSPNYNDNECNDKQKSGFNWSDLKEGISNFQYGDFDFSGGWTCANSFNKRDHISKRTFGSKCIKNKVRKDKFASFGCDKRKSGFSIDYIDVSVEFDVDLDLHYRMGDGSTCYSTWSCKVGGSTIKNSQCGGATSVEVYLGSRFSGDQKECEIGFHNIGFQCNSGTIYTSPTVGTPSSTTPTVSQPGSTAPPTETTVSSCEVMLTQPPVSTTSALCDGSSCNSLPPVTTSTIETSTQPPVPSSPPASCEGESCNNQPLVSTAVIGTPPVSSNLIETLSTSFSLFESTPVPSTPIETLPGSSVLTETPPASQTIPSTGTPSIPCNGGYGEDCSTSAVTLPASSSLIETPPASQTTSYIGTSSSSCDGSYGEECTTSFVTSTSVMTQESSTPSSVVPSTASSAPVYTSSSSPPDTPPVGQSSSVPPQSQVSIVVPPVSSPSGSLYTLKSTSASSPCYGGYGGSCEGSTTAISNPSTSTGISASSPPLVSSTTPILGTSNSTSPIPSSTGTPPSSNPPDVLPRCMNTWIQVDSTGCKDNTDSNCYCKIKDFTKNVIDCVSAWCSNDAETKQALEYLIGICADHVSENPGIVTDCPSYIPLTPTTSTASISKTASSASAVKTPCTTITVGTMEITVPQVHFSTQKGVADSNPTQTVGLVPGTAPAQTSASTTASRYPMGSTMATFAPTGIGANSTSSAEFTGAASLFGIEIEYAFLGAMLAFVAL
ncbi:hypothetical protein P153DRAFT_428421 [Dothidotthia symphoricarpi CBS 119687]|uniref:CFEM domain-containing protein n=1 Tax=Dothidotthia symphoricarpi CBS 119687 TaxID=1392245 RepID=A0A6A6AN83_9PLEO|nr:uncharacterized protein P153DRAFT_428421 [Dothidotthia symphoricarpi CBS 119687]KAF2133452.1 hypothetical protein P153DRAFT_428421 [Dothidotthia symphoricarpi CBS 119687]